MIYDTTRNLTWLADMNYAVTSGFAAANVGGTYSNEIYANGRMGWDAANSWANNLVYGGYSDWRLPALNTADTTCSTSLSSPLQYYGTGCTGGELSGLFVIELGNKALESVLNATGDTAEQIANLAMFSNVQSDAYWSGTPFPPNSDVAWGFATADGRQTYYPKSSNFFVLAVRSGDVAAPMPEPQTLALALLALGATVVARRRRPR